MSDERSTMAGAKAVNARSRHAVFFDLDGVIIDSAPLITSLAREVLGRRDVHVAADELAGFVGPPLDESFGRLLRARTGVEDRAQVGDVVTEFRALYRLRCLETAVHPGVGAMIDAISDMALCGLATSKPREFAVRIVEHLGFADRFAVIAAPEPEWRSDDKTEVLRVAYDRMQGLHPHPLPAGGCAMVGDRHHDIDAARRLGIPAIAVTWGVGSRSELSDASPDWMVDEPDEVVGVVRELIRKAP